MVRIVTGITVQKQLVTFPAGTVLGAPFCEEDPDDCCEAPQSGSGSGSGSGPDGCLTCRDLPAYPYVCLEISGFPEPDTYLNGTFLLAQVNSETYWTFAGQCPEGTGGVTFDYQVACAESVSGCARPVVYLSSYAGNIAGFYLDPLPAASATTSGSATFNNLLSLCHADPPAAGDVYTATLSATVTFTDDPTTCLGSGTGPGSGAGSGGGGDCAELPGVLCVQVEGACVGSGQITWDGGSETFSGTVTVGGESLTFTVECDSDPASDTFGQYLWSTTGCLTQSGALTGVTMPAVYLTSAYVANDSCCATGTSTDEIRFIVTDDDPCTDPDPGGAGGGGEGPPPDPPVSPCCASAVPDTLCLKTLGFCEAAVAIVFDGYAWSGTLTLDAGSLNFSMWCVEDPFDSAYGSYRYATTGCLESTGTFTGGCNPMFLTSEGVAVPAGCCAGAAGELIYFRVTDEDPCVTGGGVSGPVFDGSHCCPWQEWPESLDLAVSGCACLTDPVTLTWDETNYCWSGTSTNSCTSATASWELRCTSGGMQLYLIDADVGVYFGTAEPVCDGSWCVEGTIAVNDEGQPCAGTTLAWEVGDCSAAPPAGPSFTACCDGVALPSSLTLTLLSGECACMDTSVTLTWDGSNWVGNGGGCGAGGSHPVGWRLSCVGGDGSPDSGQFQLTMTCDGADAGSATAGWTDCSPLEVTGLLSTSAGNACCANHILMWEILE